MVSDPKESQQVGKTVQLYVDASIADVTISSSSTNNLIEEITTEHSEHIREKVDRLLGGS